MLLQHFKTNKSLLLILRLNCRQKKKVLILKICNIQILLLVFITDDTIVYFDKSSAIIFLIYVQKTDED